MTTTPSPEPQATEHRASAPTTGERLPWMARNSQVLVLADGAVEIYHGLLAAFGEEYLGRRDAGEDHQFTFTVTVNCSAGNQYQDAETTVDFDWDAG